MRSEFEYVEYIEMSSGQSVDSKGLRRNATRMRSQRGLVHTPWQFTLFKQLTASNSISLSELISSYNQVMVANGLTPMCEVNLYDILKTVELSTGDKLIQETNDGSTVITYGGFNETIKWYIQMQRKYNRMDQRVPNSIQFNSQKINSNKQSLVIATTILDIVCIGLVVWAKYKLPIWILVAKVFAIQILINLFYLFIPFLDVSDLIPDHILANGFPAEYSDYYHRVFGIKILLAGIIHTAAHFLHIHKMIGDCTNGCTRKAVALIPKSKEVVVISYGYFMKQLPYVTGVLLIVGFTIMTVSIVLSKYNLIRYTSNQVIHKFVAYLGCLLIIIHGVYQLLGFNYSFIMLLPLMIIYSWKRRNHFIPVEIKISRWLVNSNCIRLYLRETPILRAALKNFATVTVYINYPRISRLEWHPFTLPRRFILQCTL